MKPSRFLSQIAGSATAQIFARAKELEAQNREIFHLEIGQPFFQPPDFVIQATIDALKNGYTTYTVSRGIFELRSKISEYHNSENGVSIDPKTEIIVSSGAKLAIFAAVWSVTNVGDNVVILNPSWVSYGDIVRSLGAEPRYLSVDLDFNFDEEELRKLIDEKTRVLIVNSPSNPTGSLISKSNLQNLYDICAEHDILVVSDEIYSDYIYEGKHVSLLDLPSWKESGIVINGFSKTFSMTGYRLGYALGQEELITQMNKVMQLTASCPPNFGQHAAIVALEHIHEAREFIMGIMRPRRELVTSLLSELPVQYIPPRGAIYAWIKVPTDDSVAWAKKLLNEKGLATTPGRAFGPAGEGYIRLCFATTEETIVKGIKLLGEFLTA